MTYLHEIIAVEKGTRQTATRDATDLYHLLEKDALFGGLSRTYKPRADDGDQLPAEGVKVQANVEVILTGIAAALVKLYDVTLTKDVANTRAKGKILIDGEPLAEDVPVSHLLFLEKELIHIRTIVAKLPLLDPAENWHHDGASGVFVTDETVTTKSKKVPYPFIKYEATPQHPAQVEVAHNDVIVGDWTAKKFSGKVSKERRDQIVVRTDLLIAAVRTARERANMITVEDQNIGDKIFEYLFAN